MDVYNGVFYHSPLKAAEWCFSNVEDTQGYLLLVLLRVDNPEQPGVQYCYGVDETDVARGLEKKRRIYPMPPRPPAFQTYTAHSDDQICMKYLLRVQFHWNL
jgi:hypothetical protein